MKQKITLTAWAEPRWRPTPSIKTLRRWVKEHRIFPRPQKVGRTYYVEPDAAYIDPRKRLNYGSKAA